MTEDPEAMSEYETTDLGGDPVEFEFVEGGTYERGVIRSTADRQQIRRDAYHVSLSQNRQAILAQGLDPDHPLSPWHTQERGVYYFETIEHARFYRWNLACSKKIEPGSVDIFRLNIDGLPLALDTVEGVTRRRRGRVLAKVTPDRVTHVEQLDWLATELERNLAVEARLHEIEDALLTELKQADARWQEFSHPFDKAEFDAMYDQLTSLAEDHAERVNELAKLRDLLGHIWELSATRKYGAIRAAIEDAGCRPTTGASARIPYKSHTAEKLANAEARLANVPALVEAAKAASTAVKMAATIEGIDFAVPYLDEALAAWEKQ